MEQLDIETKFCIVLARRENIGVKEHETETEWRDGQLRYKLVFFDLPKACIWLNEGTAQDVKNAKEFAKKEGYKVFTFDINTKDALEQAKLLIMEKN